MVKPNKPKIVWSICECCKLPYKVAQKDLRRGRKFCSRKCSDVGKRVVLRNQYGVLNPNWKGGRSAHSKGYVYRYAPLHPRAHNNYVLEHILVMEQRLGRFLRSYEVVHHKDGVRCNNIPSNLDLFSSIGNHTQYHASLNKSREVLY